MRIFLFHFPSLLLWTMFSLQYVDDAGRTKSATKFGKSMRLNDIM